MLRPIFNKKKSQIIDQTFTKLTSVGLMKPVVYEKATIRGHLEITLITRKQVVQLHYFFGSQNAKTNFQQKNLTIDSIFY